MRGSICKHGFQVDPRFLAYCPLVAVINEGVARHLPRGCRHRPPVALRILFIIFNSTAQVYIGAGYKSFALCIAQRVPNRFSTEKKNRKKELGDRCVASIDRCVALTFQFTVNLASKIYPRYVHVEREITVVQRN